jgi:hypothetical protein
MQSSSYNNAVVVDKVGEDEDEVPVRYCTAPLFGAWMGSLTIAFFAFSVIVNKSFIPTSSVFGTNLALSSYTNSDTRTYSFHSMTGAPLGIYSSSSGKYVITSDTNGYVYRSDDYGSSFTSSRPFSLSEGDYASIYGLVMTSSGDKMVVGTMKAGIYKSTDFGQTFVAISDQKCSVLAGATSLESLLCIGGEPSPSKSYLMSSFDGGKTWAKSTDFQAQWVGILSNSDFSHIAAIQLTGSPYYFYSYNKGVKWEYHLFDESDSLSCGCLAGDSSLKQALTIDVVTRNAHMTYDDGNFFYQVFSGTTTVKLRSSTTINCCAVSRDGSWMALGFSGASVETVVDCPDPATNMDCAGEWTKQAGASSGVANTTSIAFSQDGTYLFSVDASSKQISVGKIDKDRRRW